MTNEEETVTSEAEQDSRVETLPAYCWHHSGEENGGWTCAACRMEITLPRFFAALAEFMRQEA